MNRSGRTVLTCAIVAAAVFGVAGCGVAAQREPVRLESAVLAPPATPTVTVVAEVPASPPADAARTPVSRTAPLTAVAPTPVPPAPARETTTRSTTPTP